MRDNSKFSEIPMAEFAEKKCDYDLLRLAIKNIDLAYQSQVNVYREKQQKLNDTVKKLNLAFDERLCPETITHLNEKISSLKIDYENKLCALEKTKGITQLLRKALDDIEQKTTSKDFICDVNKAIERLVHREILQKLSDKNETEAEDRKRPLQKATKAGWLKNLHEEEKNILDALLLMKTEYLDIEKQKTILESELAVYQASLKKAIDEELPSCKKNEKEKEDECNFVIKKIDEHNEDEKNKLSDYTQKYNTLALNIANEKKLLENLETTQANTERTIRETQLCINDLNTRKEKTEQYTESCNCRYRCRQIKSRTVPNLSVIAEINQKTSLLSTLKSNLASTKTSISTKKTEIDALEKKQKEHNAAWIITKEILHKEFLALEKNKRQAESDFSDVVTVRKQKENDICYFEKNISEHSHKIENSIQTLKNRDISLNNFQIKLEICQEKIRVIKEQNLEEILLAEQLSQSVESDKLVDSNSQHEKIETYSKAKLQWEMSCEKEVKFELDAVTLKNELDALFKRLKQLQEPNDLNITANRKIEENLCHAQLDKLCYDHNQANDEYYTTLHTLLLSQGLFLSGFEQLENALDNLVSTLLHGVFNEKQLYKLGGAANAPMPLAYQHFHKKIKNKFEKEYGENIENITPEKIAFIVDCLNLEFQDSDDLPIIAVNLFDEAIQTKLDIKKTTKKTLSLWKTGSHYLCLSSECEQEKLGFDLRAQRLIQAMLPPNALFSQLCREMILENCKSELNICAPERLVNYYREESQLAIPDFSAWADRLLKKLSFKSTLSADIKEIQLQALRYCLQSLNNIYSHLSEYQQSKIFKSCKDQYLSELKSLVMNEVKKRSEECSNAQRLVNENREILANKMQFITNDIKQKQSEIEKIDKEISEKQLDIEKRRNQEAELREHCESQSLEIETKIQELIKIQNDVSLELDKLNDMPSVHSEQREALKKKREETKFKLDELRAQEAELECKKKEISIAQNRLQNELIAARDNILKHKKRANDCAASKSCEENKIKFIEQWISFLTNVHQRLLDDKCSFLNRHTLLEKFSVTETIQSRTILADFYSILMKDFSCLKDLDTQEMQHLIQNAKLDDYQNMASTWHNDLRNVLEDVLGSPQIHIDGVNPIIIKGNNISWAETIETLKKEIEKRISYFGFEFNDQNKLVVKNVNLVGIINQLPERLKKLFGRYYELFYKHYTVVNQNVVDQTPRWHECEERENKIQELVESKVSIDFFEVLRVYADSIEVIAAHNLYLDKDVELPGINITFFSKDKIHCKDNLVINTTAKALPAMMVAKAQNGNTYSKDTCREGDDGLDGQPGDSAGNIILKAEKTISHLSTLKCIANGGCGVPGQEAGDGGTGHSGVDIPRAKPSLNTSGPKKAQYILAQGRTPGMDAAGNFPASLNHEHSGFGADAGRAGLGGGAGLPGDIVIIDEAHQIKLLVSENTYTDDDFKNRSVQKCGTQGEDGPRTAKGGRGGTPGATGLDFLLNKKSFFHETKPSVGKFLERAFTDPREFHKPDAAYGIGPTSFFGVTGFLADRALGIFDGVTASEATADYQKQISAVGCYTNVPMVSTESAYLSNPKRDEGSRGKKGRDSCAIERQKAAESRRKTQKTQTTQHQLAQLKTIDQVATSIAQNHNVNQHLNDYNAEAQQYRDASKKLAEEEVECNTQAEVCEKSAVKLAEQLTENEQKIQQYVSQLLQIQQLIARANDDINANDLAQLETIQAITEHNNLILQAQLSLACANIDVDSKQNLKMQFAEQASSIQNTIQLLQDKISQEIAAKEKSRLEKTQSIHALQQEYAQLEQAFNENTNTNSQEQLSHLMQELLAIDQQQEKSQLNQQAILLSDYRESDDKSMDAKTNSLVKIGTKNSTLLSSTPSIHEQCDSLLKIFKRTFPLSSAAIGDLEENVHGVEAYQVLVAVLNGLHNESQSIRAGEGLEKFKAVLQYCENILNCSQQTTEDLEKIYCGIQRLVSKFQRFDEKGGRGRVFTALGNLINTVEDRYLCLLIENAMPDNLPENEKKAKQQSLNDLINKSLLVHTEIDPELNYENKIACTFSFLTAINSFIIQQKNQSNGNVFLENFSIVLENLACPFPITDDDEPNFIAEASNFLRMLNINFLNDTYVTTTQESKKSFFYAQLAIEYSYVSELKTVVALQEIEFTYPQEDAEKNSEEMILQEQLFEQNRQKEINDILLKNKNHLFSLIKILLPLKSTYSKSLLGQVAKNYQTLAVMQKQMLFHSANPILRCKLIHALYDETISCVDRKLPGLSKEIEMMAEESISHLILTSPISIDDWIAIISQEENKLLLIDNNGLILKLIIGRILSEKNTEFLLKSYNLCMSIAPHSLMNDLSFLWRQTLNALLIKINEMLTLKLKSQPEHAHITLEICQTISKINMLWSSMNESLIPLETCLSDLEAIVALRLTEKNTLLKNEDLSILQKILVENLDAQKEALIANRPHLQIKAIYACLEIDIQAIEKYLKNRKATLAESNKLISDLDQCLFTMALLVDQDPSVLTDLEFEAIEKAQYTLKKALINNSNLDNKTDDQISFFYLLHEREAQWEKTLNQHYYKCISQSIKNAQQKSVALIKKTDDLVLEIIAAYDHFINVKKTMKTAGMSSKNQNSAQRSSPSEINTSGYYSGKKHFITLMLKKIECACLMKKDQSAIQNREKLAQALEKIKQSMSLENVTDDKALDKIEGVIQAEVNQLGISFSQSEKLFTSEVFPDVFSEAYKILKKSLQSCASFSDVFNAWLNLSKEVFKENDEKKYNDESILELINDSIKFLKSCVLENSDQENKLYELTLLIEPWFSKLTNDSAKKFEKPLLELLQLSRFSLAKSDHYLFTHRLLAMHNSEKKSRSLNESWREIEKKTIESTRELFSNISDDLGESTTKYKLIKNFPVVVIADNEAHCQNIQADIDDFFKSEKSKIPTMDPSDKSPVDFLNSVDLMKPKPAAALKKILLSLRQLPYPSLSEVKKLISHYFDYLESRIGLIQPDESYYIQLISSYLINTTENSDVVLSVLFGDTAKDFEPFEKLNESLLNKKNTWKIPYFTALIPHIPKEQFKKPYCRSLILFLLNNKYQFEKNNNFLQLLDVAIQSYIKVMLSSETDESRKILILGAKAYISEFLSSVMQDNAQQKIELTNILNHVKLYFNFVIDIPPSLDHIKINIEKLLTPLERKLIKLLSPKTKADLIKIEPKLWNAFLRKRYFQEITTQFKNSVSCDVDTSNFSELFTEAYVAAANESLWLECVEVIKSYTLSFQHVEFILQAVSAIGSAEFIYEQILKQNPPLLFIKESLFAACLQIIEKCSKENNEIDSLLKDFYSLKPAIFSHDNKGILFLHKFIKALSNYEHEEKLQLHPIYLKELLTLVRDTQAYKQDSMLSDSAKKLDDENILQWNYQLKREKYIQLFGIQENGVSKEVDDIVHYLNRIEKDCSQDLFNDLLFLLKEKFSLLGMVTVKGMLAQFSNHYWELNKSIILHLKNVSHEEWSSYLNSEAEKRLSTKIEGDRTAPAIVQEMRKDINGINSSVSNSLDPSSEWFIETLIGKINVQYEKLQKSYSTITDWEIHFKSWLEEFKKSAVNNFSHSESVIIFVAELMLACQFKLKMTPRPTQITALLLFIDSIQNGKGRLANISTGEGKSFITVMTAIVLALRNERVDIVTSNEVLAERDANESKILFNTFDIAVNNNCDKDCEKNEDLRRKRYDDCKVIYGTTSSFQKDLLLTNFFGKRIRGMPGEAKVGDSLLIDEVDSMFIDNAEKILYISHSIEDLRHLNDLFMLIWFLVNAKQSKIGTESVISEIVKQVTEQINKNAVLFPNMLDVFIKRRLETWVKNAFLAKQMELNKQYTIPGSGEKNGKIVVMDLDTGVEQNSTQWSDGLHQFIQLKHSQKLTPESLKAVFMANVTFFQSYHGRIIGMTGTLGSEAELNLMSKTYGIDFFKLPRNKAERYFQEEFPVQKNRESWILSIINEIKDKQNKEGSYSEKAIAEAKKQYEEAEVRLVSLEVEKIKCETALNDAISKCKELQLELEVINLQLARDAVAEKDSDTPNNSRADLMEKQTEIEAEIKTSNMEIAELKKLLNTINDGDTGIAFNKNKKRNADNVKNNNGARAVLVICENIQDVNDIKKAICLDPFFASRTSNREIITLKSKDDKLPVDKLGPNDIIIATNIAGRGTDFETLDVLDKNGGLEVVLSYIPSNIRIETQAFRRTARNGNRGSGKFIVYHPALENNPDLNITVDLMREIRDIEESRRIYYIHRNGIPKLKREQKLFKQFIALQKKVRDELNASLNDPKEYENRWVDVQIKSLQNQWAFFLDEISGKIADIELISDSDLDHEYQKFVLKISDLMKNIPLRLITEPAELLKMARHALDTKITKNHKDDASYLLAEEYLDAIIAKEPKFSAMAHYYKVICNFGRKKNDFQSKRAARTALKKSIALFEAKISSLSSSAQSLRYLRDRDQNMGHGLNVDDFTTAISNEVSLLQIHVNAAEEALGTALTPEKLKSGTVTGDEDSVIFKKLRKMDFIKDYRVSKKVTIKKNGVKKEIYREDKLVTLPSTFQGAAEEIATILEPKISGVRNLDPAAFKDLFLTKKMFLDIICKLNLYREDVVVTLHADIHRNLNARGQWDEGPFIDCSKECCQAIKKLILNVNKAKEKTLLINEIKDCGVTIEKASEILTYLDNRSILQLNTIYILEKTLREKIEAHLKKPETEDNTQRLLKVLNLTDAFSNPAHYRDAEVAFIQIYESNISGKPVESLLSDDTTVRYQQLWSYLKSINVVKDPKVNFGIIDDPEKLLDKIKDTIKDKISELIPDGKNEDEHKKYAESIYKTVEKAIGKIKQFEEVKIDPKTLQDFLKDGKVPPELVDYTIQCYDLVLSLAEDKGFDWGVIAVALMGLVQIAAGVLIGALSFGTAAYISAVLISEGVGDLMFAVQAGISGNFSWASYGDHKWQSLLISCATAGVAAGIGGLTTSTASLTLSSVTKRFAIEVSKAGLAIAVSFASNQLVKEVISALLNEMENNFEIWVHASGAHQIAKGRLETLFGRFYDKFGALEAQKIILQVISDNAQARSASFINTFSAKLTETMQKLSTHLSTASASGNSTVALASNILSVASKIVKAGDIVIKLREIASMTSETFSLLEKSLDDAFNKSALSQADVVHDEKYNLAKKDFCENLLAKQTAAIVSEVKQFIKQNIMQPGTQALLQSATEPLSLLLNNEAEKALKEGILEVRRSAEEAMKLVGGNGSVNTMNAESNISTLTPPPVPSPTKHRHANRRPATHSSSQTANAVDATPAATQEQKSDDFAQKTQAMSKKTDLSLAETATQSGACMLMATNGVLLSGMALSAGATDGLSVLMMGARMTLLADDFASNAYHCFTGNNVDSSLKTALHANFPTASREIEFIMNTVSLMYGQGKMNYFSSNLNMAGSMLFSRGVTAFNKFNFFGAAKQKTTLSTWEVSPALREKYGALSSQERMARIDDLSKYNYERRAWDLISTQGHVNRYLSEKTFQASQKYGTVRGYSTTVDSTSSSEVLRRAQIDPEWGVPKYCATIPASEISGIQIARPFGDTGKHGWEFFTNSYPKLGPGHWPQFIVHDVDITKTKITELSR